MITPPLKPEAVITIAMSRKYLLNVARTPSEVDNIIGSTVYAEDGTVHAKIVIGCGSPGAEGIIIIIGLAGAVFVADEVFRLFRADFFAFHKPLDAVLHGSAYEYVQAGEVAQDIIGTSADDDGVALLGYAPDYDFARGLNEAIQWYKENL